MKKHHNKKKKNKEKKKQNIVIHSIMGMSEYWFPHVL